MLELDGNAMIGRYGGCFEEGDRKSQQNELELMLELDGDFFGEEDEVCGCRNKWRGPPWAHEAGGAPWTLMARCLLPCCVLSTKYSQIFQKKSY